MSKLNFDELKLNPALISNLQSLGYKHMTPIQAQSLPAILEGKDVIAQGKTGSGKTAAFSLGLLEALKVKQFRVQGLVLCPTRELADQVAKEIRRLGRTIHNIKVLTLCGGMPFGPQKGSLEHGAHIIVGTPGRIEEHLSKGNLSLANLTYFVLDEADRMLDMGFQDTLDKIIEYAPANRQTLLFSATFPEQIESIAQRVMNNPIRVAVDNSHDSASIDQQFFNIDKLEVDRKAGKRSEVNKGAGRSELDERRITAVRLLLLANKPVSTVIFCTTKKETQALADELRAYGFEALALHGDLEQRDRDQTLVRFINRSISILVATDVAARGLDIDELDAVVNYHIARDLEVHVHRVGRTGRAGSKGVAYSLFSEKERHKLGLLGELINLDIQERRLPPLSTLDAKPFAPEMVTLQIDGGKKQKVRPGDIVGALTGDGGIDGASVGKIQLFDNWAYVAVQRNVVSTALEKIGQGKLKGRTFRVRKI